MDYMELIKKSISQAWRHKFLWLFGFFVSVSDGFGGFQWMEDLSDKDFRHRWEGDFGDFYIDPALIAFLILAALALWILFWVMSTLSEGSLIHGVSRKVQNLEVDFADCWSAGLNKFFRLFGIMLMATLLGLFVLFTLIVGVIPMYIAAIPLGIIFTVLGIPILLIFIFVIVMIEGWAIRFAVLYDETWLDAIGSGWRLFRTNIGKSIGVAFSSFLTQIVIFCLLILGLLILAIPLFIVGWDNIWNGLIPGISLLLVVMILSAAFFGTFASSVWTIGFMQLTGYRVGETATATDSNIPPPPPESGNIPPG